MECPSSPSSSSSCFSEDIRKYELHHELGVGSFGRVYEAVYRPSITSPGRVCAVKKIEKKSTPNTEKIRTEFMIHNRCEHENIVRLFRAIEDEKFVYLVMELCAGGSLKGLIKSCAAHQSQNSSSSSSKRTPTIRTSPDKNKNSPCSGYGSFRRSNSEIGLFRNSPSASFKSADGQQSPHPQLLSTTCPVVPYPLMRSVLRQLCKGLEYLHRNNVVHRDLNTNNILLETPIQPHSHRAHRDIRIKIADFGLAIDKSMSLHQKQGFVTAGAAGTTICGTPGFISPEVWRQESPVSPASDIYSLGSILYAMMTGITSPKGNLNVDSFPPLLASLINSLMHHRPEKRLHVKDIMEHPFTLGPLDTRRLPATTVTAKNQQMTIQEDRTVVVSFLDKDCSISISNDSKELVVRTRKSEKVYSPETLPQNRWKWFARAHDFVRGLKSTTPKIKKFCKYDCKVSSIDGQGNRLTIVGAVLTESSTFKLFVLDEVRGTQQKLYFNPRLEYDNSVLYKQARDLYEKVLRLEDTLEALSEKEGEDYFPFTSGKNPLSKNSPTPASGPKSCVTSRSLGTGISNRSHTVTVEDVTSACKVPDGFLVNFSDGSSLMYTTDSQITYSEAADAPKMRFNANSPLPVVVQEKLSVIPAIINAGTSMCRENRSLSSSRRSSSSRSHVT